MDQAANEIGGPMTKDQVDSLTIGDRILWKINQTTYQVVKVDCSRIFGSGFELESPDGYCRFITKSDASREFQLVNDQED